jgi:hypothetical protein
VVICSSRTETRVCVLPGLDARGIAERVSALLATGLEPLVHVWLRVGREERAGCDPGRLVSRS